MLHSHWGRNTLMAFFWKEVKALKIKKVDDKPMVIHTKEKAKIHSHEPKKAKIKGSNIYTVQRVRRLLVQR
mgnify:CR=1 FL=1